MTIAPAPTPVSGKPDLLVSVLTLPTTTVKAGDSVTLAVTVKNSGTADAAGTYGRFCLNDAATCATSATNQISRLFVTALTVGGTKSVSTLWTATKGSNTITWCTDVTGTVAEADETNNCSSKTLTVQ